MCRSLILSGSPDSFARYPKWAQTFENELSFEFKTRMSNALLLYTDDSAVQHNFFTISLLDGHLQVEFRLGEKQLELPERRPVIHITFLNAPRVDDGQWHRFSFFQAWENVRVQLDEEKAFRVLGQRTFALGNIRTNSDVFVGGIPKEIEKLSSPLRRHSKHFAGALRNLVYGLFPQGVSNAQLMDSIGTRKTDEDYCQPMTSSSASRAKLAHTAGGAGDGTGYCHNEGRCYSANNGARCDCSDSEYEGRRCEIKKPSSEVSFFGNEWLGYDLRRTTTTQQQQQQFMPGGDRSAPPLNGDTDSGEMLMDDEPQAVWSLRQVFNITFRTNSSNSLLLLAGDGRSHVELFLEKGVILARSQLAGSEKRMLRVQDRALRRVHLDDNLWHSVTLVRELSTTALKNAVFSMRLVVDDFFNQEVRQFAALSRLGNAFLFLGGAPSELANKLVPDNLFPFRGCIKKAFFQSGPVKLNLIALADQGFGQSHVQTFGDLSYSCSPNAQVPEVFAFNSGQNFTKLPAWNSPSRGTLAFQFRTLLPEGLLLYHGQTNCPNFTICDYLAFELIDGHLMV
uniref:Neurexin-1 n=1 Tax=Globodera rostochiensis TaxID=31243 RepID=A0A914HGE6_GLORO